MTGATASAPVDRLLERLEQVKKVNGGWMARCPAHDDRKASLSIGEGQDGRALVCCQAGCATADVLATRGLTMADLMPEQPSGNGAGALGEIVATYPYTDESGQLLFEVVRFAPKTFRPRRPDGNGGWIWNLKDTRRVLYRLPEVIAAVAAGEDVWVAEGERDVDALRAAGVTATTNSGGAGKWRPEYSAWLKGAPVIIVADKDEAGRKHAAQVVAALEGIASSVLTVEAKVGKDASDHLAGLPVDDFVTVTAAAEDEGQDAAASPYIDWSTFWAHVDHTDEWIYPDVLARARGHSIYAKRKDGKSLFGVFLALRLATGPEKIVVLYFDYEMTEGDLRERLDDMGADPDTDLSRLRYDLLPTLPPLDTAAGGQALQERLDELQAAWPEHEIVAIFDTYGRAVQGPESDADTTRAFYIFSGIELKRRGVTWVRFDHAGYDETHPRGSTAKGDDVDVVWKLEKTANGMQLKRDAARMPWVPEKVTFRMTDYPLAYERLTSDWAAGTQEIANALDQLGLPLDAPYRSAQKALRGAGKGKGTDTIRDALRWRRERPGREP